MSKRLQVLIIEDSEDDTLFLLRELKRGGFTPEYERVETLPRLTAALDRQNWDLIISDHSLNGFNSLHALELVSQQKLDIPFIIVSGIIGEEVAVRAMKAGAHDYVMKNQLARLVPSIERELREAQSRRAQRKAEEALRRSEQELNDFFERASVGLQWLGPDGAILRVNQAELDLLGYEHEEYAGHLITEFYVDTYLANDLLKRLHDGEVLNNFEVRVRCKNGDIKHVLINANVLREDGKFIHARCFMRDITDRKAAAAAVSYLAAIVENSEDAIIGTSLVGEILTWNRGAELMYGYTAEEVKGCSISILAPLSRPEHWPQIYDRIRHGEKIEHLETIRHRKNGSAVEVSLTFSLIKDGRGNVIGISAIERDITLRKREEEERSKLIAELTDALGKIKTLRGLLPICAACKKIRDDGGYWQKIEAYICEHTEAEFTHGICPDCLVKLYPQYPIASKFLPVT
ncbi:MAG TPA: PAS domain S-box protein [Verrucomicrobiae bacterium]|jgi:PAS domain S-box-containing protein|nr:PAS domain S-box protein [Verrucomicrobiae bacterium]